jgi:hypothetical protein
MNILSSKFPVMIMVGFAISLASVVLNTLVLSSINSRLRAAESEYFDLAESLGKQAAQLNEADLKFDLYLIMHNVAFTSPASKAKDAREDAGTLLKRFLTKYYAAANDIAPIELTRVEVEEAGEIIPRLEKILGMLVA